MSSETLEPQAVPEAGAAIPPEKPISVKGGPKNWAETHDLALAWTAAFILGSLAITVSASRQAILSIWQHLVPLVVMTAYVVFAFRRSSFNRSRVADSAYFLGFLWTLVTMVVTVLSRGERIGPSDLINVFAVALTTTAGGLFARTLLVQFQRSTGDQEAEASDAIDQRLQRLLEALDRSVSEVDGFSRVLAESHRSAMEQVRVDVSTALVGFSESARSVADGLIQELHADSARVREEVAEYRRLHEDNREAVKARSAQVSKSASQLVARIDEMSAAAKGGGESLQAAIQLVSDSILNAELPTAALGRRLNEIAELTAKANEEHVKALERSTNTLQLRIQALAGAVLEVPGRAQVEEKFRDLVKGLEATKSAASEAGEALKQVTGVAAAAGQALAALPDNVLKLGRAADSSADRLLASSKRLDGLLQEAAVTAARANSDMEKAKGTSVEMVEFVAKRLTEARR